MEEDWHCWVYKEFTSPEKWELAPRRAEKGHGMEGTMTEQVLWVPSPDKYPLWDQNRNQAPSTMDDCESQTDSERISRYHEQETWASCSFPATFKSQRQILRLRKHERATDVCCNPEKNLRSSDFTKETVPYSNPRPAFFGYTSCKSYPYKDRQPSCADRSGPWEVKSWLTWPPIKFQIQLQPPILYPSSIPTISDRPCSSPRCSPP